VSALADAVLPLIRTRADVSRWDVANEHGDQMHQAVEILQAAVEFEDPADVFAVIQKAIASAISVLSYADDSSGVIGEACEMLLDLHPKAAARAKPPVSKLVNWMVTFQFENDWGFNLDPVAYAPALGHKGMASYRAKLDDVAAGQGLQMSQENEWTTSNGASLWFTLNWIAQRLAVLDRDVEAIIRTHLRDRTVAAWLHHTAEALAEIGEFDLAIDWARRALDVGPAHQSLSAGEYWCTLLARHRSGELTDALLEVFRRWPSASTAAHLYKGARKAWAQHRDEVMERLAVSPRDAVLFALQTLRDASYAWDLAHQLALADDHTWSDLVKAYEKIDPIAVLPVLNRLVLTDLVESKAQNYQIAARRLNKMRALAAGSEYADEINQFIAELRDANRRRPRLQYEFDRFGLP
jgi:hypothetical protein